MPAVEMTSHLYRFFPALEHRAITVSPGSVAEVLREIDGMARGFSEYIVDEHGALRRHVNISIDNALVVDRKTLSDRVPEHATLYIFQALSGG